MTSSYYAIPMDRRTIAPMSLYSRSTFDGSLTLHPVED